MKEIELILTKLKIVSEEKEQGAYICDKEHSKILLDYIQQRDNIIKEAREYIEKEYVQVKNKEYNLSWNNLEYIIKELLEILDKGGDDLSDVITTQ